MNFEYDGTKLKRRRDYFQSKKGCLSLFVAIVVSVTLYSPSLIKFGAKSLPEDVHGNTNNAHRSTEVYDDTSGDRPIMYTFYNTIAQNGSSDTPGDKELLELWKEKWNEAGWDARVLNMDDAKNHPRYEEFAEKVELVPLRVHDLYNRFCFYRWLAVASVGGGWMSDMDVFPLNFHEPDVYFQDGRFAIYFRAPRGGVPCLMSGSQSEWERLAFATVENGVEHGGHKKGVSWTDMFASIDLYIKNPESYELFDMTSEAKKVDWNEGTCNEFSQKLAVHFSHFAVQHKMGLKDISKRAEMAGDWMNEWKKSCQDLETIDLA